MNKAMSKKNAAALIDGGTLTWGALKQKLATMQGASGTSLLNPGLTKAHAVQILSDGIKEYADDKKPEPYRYDAFRNRHVRGHDFLVASNILREVGAP